MAKNNSVRLGFVALVFVAFVGGCGTDRSEKPAAASAPPAPVVFGAAPPPAPSSAPVAVGAGAPKATSSAVGAIAVTRIPVRDVLPADATPPPGYGAYGYLIFPRKPSAKETDRYVAVCEAYRRDLESVSDYAHVAPDLLMPTYWLTTKGFKAKGSSCKEWVKQYDYARAKKLASAISALATTGPLLVAWRQPFEKVAVGDGALIVDLSRFAVDDLDRAFGIWSDHLSRKPELWKDGLRLVLAKEAFRGFLEKYGDSVVKAVSTVKELIG